MKKLNRKGFTLVELLAVIIILAIVVGITIPAVLTTTEKAKGKAFQTAADTAADWFDRQYQVALTGLGDAEIATLDENFIAVCGSDGKKCTDAEGETVNDKKQLGAAGLKATNVSKMVVIINESTGRTCVILTAADGGDYDNVGEKITATAADEAGNVKVVAEYYTQKSSNCD